MTRFALLLPLLAACSGTPALKEASKEDHPYYFVTSPLAWGLPPAELAKNYEEAYGDIVLVYPSGGISVLSVTFFKDRQSGSVSVCSGCGFSHRAGTWMKLSGSARFVENSRWVYRQGVRLDDPANVATIEKLWTFKGEMPGGLTSIRNEISDYGSLFQIENPETISAFLRERSN